MIFVLYISYYTYIYDEMEMHCDLLNVNIKKIKKILESMLNDDRYYMELY